VDFTRPERTAQPEVPWTQRPLTPSEGVGIKLALYGCMSGVDPETADRGRRQDIPRRTIVIWVVWGC
jgi:hypothetical protein